MTSSGFTRNVLQFFLDGLSAPMFALDADLRYVAFNRAHAVLASTRCGTELRRGLALADVVSTAELAALLPPLRRALSGEVVHAVGSPDSFPFDGRDLEVTYEPLRGDDGAIIGVGVVAHDVTDARRALEAERRLRQSEDHLRQQQKLESLGTLASGVAHEINNPINVILNYAELIAEEAPEGAARDFAGQVTREAERVARIVRDLLHFARREKPARAEADVAELVSETVSLIEASLRKDHARLDVLLEPELPPLVCRAQQVQQVLLNLLTNARDALNQRYPDGSPDKRVALWVTRLARENGDWVRFEVEDHGSGIPADVAPRVFDPFFTTKPRDRGTGLGLSISYGIVRDHGGSITFDDLPGGGTRFRVDLPAFGGPEEPSPWPAS